MTEQQKLAKVKEALTIAQIEKFTTIVENSEKALAKLGITFENRDQLVEYLNKNVQAVRYKEEPFKTFYVLNEKKVLFYVVYK